eukprot:5280335-Amphidinium_carterae.1
MLPNFVAIGSRRRLELRNRRIMPYCASHKERLASSVTHAIAGTIQLKAMTNGMHANLTCASSDFGVTVRIGSEIHLAVVLNGKQVVAAMQK